MDSDKEHRRNRQIYRQIHRNTCMILVGQGGPYPTLIYRPVLYGCQAFFENSMELEPDDILG